jgi:hypothetical protein
MDASLAFFLFLPALALTGADIKLDVRMDAKTSIPLALTDELASADYDIESMKRAINEAINDPSPQDAIIVSIPDIDALREPLLAAREKNIPVIAVYSGLQAAKELNILAVMSDEVRVNHSSLTEGAIKKKIFLRAINEMMSGTSLCVRNAITSLLYSFSYPIFVLSFRSSRLED